MDKETGVPSERDWREEAEERRAVIERRRDEARKNRVYLAPGPIIQAILIANLISAAVMIGLYVLLH